MRINKRNMLTFFCALAAFCVSCNGAQTDGGSDERLDLRTLLSTDDTTGYARANHPRRFHFPRDHGPHPAFRSEWWYVTGNLSSGDGQRFGFQLTFFRSALAPAYESGSSAWRDNQAWMAHFALTDVAGRAHHSFERFSRAGNQLAGATAWPLRVWLDDWRLEGDASDAPVPAMSLVAREGDTSLELSLVATKPVVLQGDDGLSQKGSAPGNASYYYSLSRLRANGTLVMDATPISVSGGAWIDREWSTSALDEGQAGWDWFALQLDDSTEFMYYQLRREDGTASPQSRGVLIDPSGQTRAITSGEITLDILDRWQSPLGGTYPAGWRFRVPGQDLDLVVTPLLADQELDLSIRYWEGAVRVAGTGNGFGYVELTGYAAR